MLSQIIWSPVYAPPTKLMTVFITIIYLSSQVAMLVFTSVRGSSLAAELRKKVNADTCRLRVDQSCTPWSM